MGAFAEAIVALLLFFFGIVVGARVGVELARGCVTRREYWIANVRVLAVGTLASALIWATGWLLLAGVAVGAMAGAIATLKMEFGESVGPWQALDRALGVNKDQLRRAKQSARAEAVRRARRDGGREPELMGVQDGADGDAPTT